MMQQRRSRLHWDPITTRTAAVFWLLTLACGNEVVDDASPARLELSPRSLDFGEVPLGAQREGVLRLTTPDMVAQIEAIELGEGDATVFRPAPLASMTLIPGRPEELRVVFRPEAAEPSAGRLRVQFAEGALPPEPAVFEIPLSGRGVLVPPEVEPGNLDFGLVATGRAKTLELTVRNPTDFAMFIALTESTNARRCSQSGPAVFCYEAPSGLNGPQGHRLEPRSAMTVEVSFLPSIAGLAEQGALQFTFCEDPRCAVTVRLEGTPVESAFRCRPETLDFGVGQDCRSQTLRCTNISDQTRTIRGWSTTLDTSAAFSVSASRVTNLNPGEALEITADYCPMGLVEHRGAIEFEPDDDQRFRVDLRGSTGGPDIRVEPEAIDFGIATLLASSRRRIGIANVGTDDLVVRSILADLNGSGAFSLSSPPPTTVIASGEVFFLEVEFSPVVEGVVQSVLSISSDDPDMNDLRVPLTGEGVDLPPCTYWLSALDLDFGTQAALTSTTSQILIQNIGNTDCVIMGLSLAPGTDPEFSLVAPETAVGRLVAGERQALEVRFEPRGPGTFQGSLELGISAATPWISIPLHGNAR